MSRRAAPVYDRGMSLLGALVPLVVAIFVTSQAHGQTAADWIRSAYDADTHHSTVEFTGRRACRGVSAPPARAWYLEKEEAREHTRRTKSRRRPSLWCTAGDALSQALDLAPDPVRASRVLCDIGFCLYGLGRYEDACTVLSAVAEQAP
jgi:hypothetical protein